MAEPEGLDAVLAADSVVVLPRAPEPRELPRLDVDPAAVARLTVKRAGSGPLTVEELLHRHSARGLVVVHRGRLAYEWFTGNPSRRRPCFSVTKSFTGTLAALAVHEGVLERGASVGELVPELASGGFGDATVGQVADMTASVGYTEDYSTGGLPPGSADAAVFGFNDYLAAIRPGGPSTLRPWLARIGPGPRPHGEVFDYATPKTDVLGWVLETVRAGLRGPNAGAGLRGPNAGAGLRGPNAGAGGYVELLNRTIWDRVGAAHDATLALDPTGTPMLGAGLAVTTHDLARAGLALLEVVPPAVLESIRSGGDTGAFARGGHYDYLTGYAYADQWWLAGGPNRPLSAWGIHGQVLWVDPDAEVIVAGHCASPAASYPDRDLDQDALCRALTSWAVDLP